MQTGYSADPYKPTAVVAPVAASSRVRGWIALCEACLGVMLLVLAAAMALLMVAYLLWAVSAGSAPLFGMFMAASIQAGIALMLGIPGSLLLVAARATHAASVDNDASSTDRMRRTHWHILFALLAIALLCVGAVAAFAVALAFSNM